MCNFIYFCADIDNEGVIAADNDPPQEMGDDTVEVSDNALQNHGFTIFTEYVFLAVCL